MTRIISNVLKDLCIFISYIYPPRLHEKMQTIKDQLYTYYVSRTYKKCDGIVERGSKVKGTQYITLNKRARISKASRIEVIDSFLGEKYNPELIIGEKCRIGHGVHITVINKVVIGDYTNIGDRCLVSDNNHGDFSKNSYTFENNPKVPDVFLMYEMQRPLHSKGPVVIEHSCQIGEGSVILTGVTIGHNSIVSSNSFVRSDVPPYSIVAGNPAKVIRTFSDVGDSE